MILFGYNGVKFSNDSPAILRKFALFRSKIIHKHFYHTNLNRLLIAVRLFRETVPRNNKYFFDVKQPRNHKYLK